VIRKKSAIAFAFIVALMALFLYGKHFLFKMDWEYISSATLPDGAFTIKHYQSRSEAGHAPYGDNLVIESWKSFPASKSGETFFAGYCGKEFMYKWDGNEKIIIRCPCIFWPIPITDSGLNRSPILEHSDH